MEAISEEVNCGEIKFLRGASEIFVCRSRGSGNLVFFKIEVSTSTYQIMGIGSVVENFRAFNVWGERNVVGLSERNQLAVYSVDAAGANVLSLANSLKLESKELLFTLAVVGDYILLGQSSKKIYLYFIDSASYQLQLSQVYLSEEISGIDEMIALSRRRILVIDKASHDYWVLEVNSGAFRLEKIEARGQLSLGLVALEPAHHRLVAANSDGNLLFF